jgi:hypothetical protein
MLSYIALGDLIGDVKELERRGGIYTGVEGNRCKRDWKTSDAPDDSGELPCFPCFTHNSLTAMMSAQMPAHVAVSRHGEAP